MNIPLVVVTVASLGLTTTVFAAPPEVQVVAPVQREIADSEDFVGRVEPRASVELRARVSGYVTRVLFKDGATVKKGELLFEIDPRPYMAELDKAKAEVQRQEAHVRRAAADLERVKRLMAAGANVVARDEVDKAESDRVIAEAALRGAQAVFNAAALQLEFTHVTSPIEGQIGRALLGPGSLAKADETVLATVVSMDPLYVGFDVDERTVLRLAQLQREGKAPVAGQTVTMAMAHDNSFVRQAVIDFRDNRINPATGTQRWRAIFADADHSIMPGMSARVRVVTSAPFAALMIPGGAIQGSGAQRFVYIVNKENVVERRPVKPGSWQGELRAVTAGLTAEDRVIPMLPKSVAVGATVQPKP
ncbi:MAG: efflux RND transporter periplasmic adaptor subunit [Gemmataceae bacterium]